MKEKYKLIGTIVGVCLFIILISSITYAIYTWATSDDEESDIEGTADCFKVVYTKGDDIGSDGSIEELQMGSSYTDGVSTTVKVKIDNSCNVTSGVGTLYLNTTEISDVLRDNNIVSYQILDNGVVKDNGIINSIGTIPIYENFTINTIEKNIDVYIWINGEYVTNSNVQDVLDSVYSGNITAKVESR